MTLSFLRRWVVSPPSNPFMFRASLAAPLTFESSFKLNDGRPGSLPGPSLKNFFFPQSFSFATRLSLPDPYGLPPPASPWPSGRSHPLSQVHLSAPATPPGAVSYPTWSASKSVVTPCQRRFRLVLPHLPLFATTVTSKLVTSFHLPPFLFTTLLPDCVPGAHILLRKTEKVLRFFPHHRARHCSGWPSPFFLPPPPPFPSKAQACGSSPHVQVKAAENA